MNNPIKLTHGIPLHNYFTIIIPYNHDQHKPIANGEKPTYELTDNKIKEIKINANAEAVLKYNVDLIPLFFSRLAYGFTPEETAAILKNKYPQLNNKDAFVTIVLMKKV